VPVPVELEELRRAVGDLQKKIAKLRADAATAAKRAAEELETERVAQADHLQARAAMREVVTQDVVPMEDFESAREFLHLTEDVATNAFLARLRWERKESEALLQIRQAELDLQLADAAAARWGLVLQFRAAP